MPHITLHALDDQLHGHEAELITALTEAVVEVYGDWARDIAVVQLVGVQPGRWGVGGRQVTDVAPAVTFGVREGALTRPEGPEMARRLAAAVTDAVVGVLGEQHRAGLTVELVGTPEGRSAVGGVLV